MRTNPPFLSLSSPEQCLDDIPMDMAGHMNDIPSPPQGLDDIPMDMADEEDYEDYGDEEDEDPGGEEEEEDDSDGWQSEDDPEKLWCICRQPHNNRLVDMQHDRLAHKRGNSVPRCRVGGVGGFDTSRPGWVQGRLCKYLT